MKKKILAIVLGLCIATTCAFAKGGNIGPGIGTILMDAVGLNGLLWDVVGLSTNDTFWPVKFGALTLGTSGAGKWSKFALAPTEQFIEENLDFVATDIAKGNGEYLDTVATLLEVEDVEAFKANAQAHFDVLFPTAEVTAAEVTQGLVALL